MLLPQETDELICLVATLDRPNLLQQFQSYRASFPLDFTAEFLDTTPLDRLRHIFLAICLRCQRLPDMTPRATAAA